VCPNKGIVVSGSGSDAEAPASPSVLAEEYHPLKDPLVNLSNPKGFSILGDGSSKARALSVSTGGNIDAETVSKIRLGQIPAPDGTPIRSDFV
jgi:hypothetical protein